MEIAGLTDRFDSGHLKEMSLEELLDLQHKAEEKHAEIQMQLESLRVAGGVSREHASSLVEYLPPEMVLESFTSQVTHTNYDLACESLSTAAKIAIGVAIMAGLGAVMYYAVRTVGKNIEKSNTRIEEVQKRVAAANEQLRNEIRQSEEASAAAEAATVAAREEMAEKFVQSSPNNYLLGKLRNLSVLRGTMHNPGEDLKNLIHQLKINVGKDYNSLLLPAIDAVVKYAESGGRVDNVAKLFEEMDAKIAPDNSMHNARLFYRFVREQIVSMGGTPDNFPEDVIASAEALKAWATGQDLLSQDEIRRLIIDLRKNSRVELKVPPLGDSLRELDDVIKLTKDLPKQEKRLQAIKGQIPSDYKAVLMRYIDLMKINVQTVEVIVSLINLEIQAFNRMAMVLGRASIYEIEKVVAAMDNLVMDEESSNKIKSVAMKVKSEMQSLKGMLAAGK